MKRLLLGLLMGGIVTGVNAQVKYSQDFENGFGDMILIDVDKKAPNANVSVYKDAWTIRTADGDNWAVSNSWYEPVGKADDWMITPEITDITANTVLAWTAFSADAQFKDSYEVKVSVTGAATTDFTKTLFSKAGEDGTPVDRSISLKDYAGKTIRLAFRNISNDKFLLFVDDIMVFDAPNKDAALVSSDAKKYVLKGGETSINYSIKNTGLTTINQMEIEWTDGVETHKDVLTGLDIKFFQSYTGTFDTKVPVESAEQINIVARVVSVNGVPDSVVENNVNTLVVRGLDKDIPLKMVVEEATGTWCGWCPRGAINMASMREKYPDEFVGIAVHNEDPMMNDEYDLGLTTLPGFGGFPSVIINRSAIEDPADMETILLETVRNESGPVAVEVASTIVDRTISVEAAIDFNTQFIDEDLKLIAVLVEDGVTGTGAGFNQVNYYAANAAGPMGGFESLPNPVPAADMTYNEVGRELLFGFEGRSNTFGAEVNAGDFADLAFDIEVPADYNINNVFVVVMVADGAGAILGGAHTESKAVSSKDVTEDGFGLSLTPNPAFDVTYVNVNLEQKSEVSMKIVNQMGQTIASKNYGELNGKQVLPVITQDFGSGLFFVQMQIGNKQETLKLMVK
ncbi:MAG: choice-of-anchor J domain-containing protein [Saprospiraceae bacterium]|jgi:thiol-disulfide isomerase/thioredoxin|nr:choice-of-anchor J domain-containing protein [Saprospiraceae bacterium]MBP9194744.1 choice-of-anchor J domain-containing protein [Saprospiraceae bacterium]